VFVLAHPEGHVAVSQPAHALMCGQMARAWGNEAFGAFEPRGIVEFAADHHDMGMEGERPRLDPHTGLPKPFDALPHDQHVPPQFDGPERVAELDPYAGLLASLHHASFYRRTSRMAVLTHDGRVERRALRRAARLQARLRAELGAPEAEVDRNRRLVTYWDGLSHDLLRGRWPRERTGVPAAGGTRSVTLAPVVAGLEPADAPVDGRFTVDPWPFTRSRERFTAEGRLLRERCSDQAQLDAAFESAAAVEVSYVLEPA
jgi:uncharacterized protein DUF3891